MNQDKFLRILGDPGNLPIIKGDEDVVDTTTNTSYWQAYRYSPTLKDAKYILVWSAEIANTNTNYGTKFRLQMNDSVTITEPAYQPMATNAWIAIGGLYAWDTGADGVVNFDFDIATTNATGTAKIRRKRIILIKVKE